MPANRPRHRRNIHTFAESKQLDVEEDDEYKFDDEEDLSQWQKPRHLRRRKSSNNHSSSDEDEQVVFVQPPPSTAFGDVLHRLRGAKDQVDPVLYHVLRYFASKGTRGRQPVGLFKKAAPVSEIRMLVDELVHHPQQADASVQEQDNPHVLSSALLYSLKKNPPLFTGSAYEIVLSCHASDQDDNNENDENGGQRPNTDDEVINGVNICRLRQLVSSLPESARASLVVLFHFLSVLSSSSSNTSGSTPANLRPASLAQTFGPAICRPAEGAYMSVRHRNGLPKIVPIVEILMTHFSKFDDAFQQYSPFPHSATPTPAVAFSPTRSPAKKHPFMPVALNITLPNTIQSAPTAKSSKSSPPTRTPKSLLHHASVDRVISRTVDMLFDAQTFDAYIASRDRESGKSLLQPQSRLQSWVTDPTEPQTDPVDPQTDLDRCSSGEQQPPSRAVNSINRLGDSASPECEDADETDNLARRPQTTADPAEALLYRGSDETVSTRPSKAAAHLVKAAGRPSTASARPSERTTTARKRPDKTAGKTTHRNDGSDLSQRKKMVIACKAMKRELERATKMIEAEPFPSDKQRAQRDKLKYAYRSMKKTIRNDAAWQIQRVYFAHRRRKCAISLASSTPRSAPPHAQGEQSAATRVAHRSMSFSSSTSSKSQLLRKKREIKSQLKQFDVDFARKHGRRPSKKDKEAIRRLYETYNQVKQKIDSLEPGSAKAEKKKKSTRASNIGDGSSKAASWDGKFHYHAAKKETTDANEVQVKDTCIPDHLMAKEDLAKEKKALQVKLRKFEKHFLQHHGRKVKYSRDIQGLEPEYQRYKQLKALLNDGKR